MFKNLYIILKNLKGIEIKNYSLIKQIKPLAIALIVVGIITGFLYNVAISLQKGETISTSGRRGIIKKIFVAIAEFFGPTGSLIIGGLLLLFLIYGLVNTIRKPKEGKVIKIKNNPELIFSL